MSSRAGIGMAIATYNRREQLFRPVPSIRAHTQARVTVVMFADGSQDGSQEAVPPLVSAYVRSENRGITVHKIRELIPEDDRLVTESGWLKAWKRAIDHHGPINLAVPQWSEATPEFHGGRGTPQHPGTVDAREWLRHGRPNPPDEVLHRRSQPPLLGVSRRTRRMDRTLDRRSDGGAVSPCGRVSFALSHGLTLQPAQSSAAPEQIASNLEGFLSLREAGYPRERRPCLAPEAQRDILQPFRPLTPGGAKRGR